MSDLPAESPNSEVLFWFWFLLFLSSSCSSSSSCPSCSSEKNFKGVHWL